MADRIVAMAEGNARDRLATNASSRNLARRGQWFGFIIIMAVILGGFVMLYLDKGISGLSLILTALAVLVGAFLYGHRTQRDDAQQQPKLPFD